MTQFKEGDKVLLKMKVSEYASKPQMIWATVSKEGSEGIFLMNEYDLIPASALDVNKELLEACKEAREYFYPAEPTYTRLCEAIAAAEKAA